MGRVGDGGQIRVPGDQLLGCAGLGVSDSPPESGDTLSRRSGMEASDTEGPGTLAPSGERTSLEGQPEACSSCCGPSLLPGCSRSWSQLTVPALEESGRAVLRLKGPGPEGLMPGQLRSAFPTPSPRCAPWNIELHGRRGSRRD